MIMRGPRCVFFKFENYYANYRSGKMDIKTSIDYRVNGNKYSQKEITALTIEPDVNSGCANKVVLTGRDIVMKGSLTSDKFVLPKRSAYQKENKDANPEPGELYFDTTTNKARIWDGTQWRDLW
tara:strand:- start:1295 stop:1666 length:372 start_codon:yes stop_codon:yes gene_type:complete